MTQRSYKGRNACIFPFAAQTWIAAGILITVILLQAMSQQYPDSIDDYPDTCKLEDLGFHVIPHITVEWKVYYPDWIPFDINNLADVWVIVSAALCIAMVLIFYDRPQLVLRRFLLVHASILFLRGLCLITTVYPKLPFKADPFRASNPVWGALLILSGVRVSSKDYMFSGHTALFVLTLCTAVRYSPIRWGFPGRVYNAFWWIFNMVGVWSIIAVREHYTADVVVSLIISFFTFISYHLLLDSQWIRSWRPGIEIICTEDVRLQLPLKLIDSSMPPQENWIVATQIRTIIQEQPTMLLPVGSIQERVDENGIRHSYVVPWGRATYTRARIMSWLAWLDYE